LKVAPKKNLDDHEDGEDSQNDETLYSEGMYVAFIDASDSLEKFKIA